MLESSNETRWSAAAKSRNQNDRHDLSDIVKPMLLFA
jgi:hypothetical protein